MNALLSEAFESGRGAQAVLGIGKYFISNVTYVDSHDDVYVIREMLKWSLENKCMYKFDYYMCKSLHRPVCDGEPLVMVGVALAYAIVADDVGDTAYRTKVIDCIKDMLGLESVFISRSLEAQALVAGVVNRLPQTLP